MLLIHPQISCCYYCVIIIVPAPSDTLLRDCLITFLISMLHTMLVGGDSNNRCISQCIISSNTCNNIYTTMFRMCRSRKKWLCESENVSFGVIICYLQYYCSLLTHALTLCLSSELLFVCRNRRRPDNGITQTFLTNIRFQFQENVCFKCITFGVLELNSQVNLKCSWDNYQAIHMCHVNFCHLVRCDSIPGIIIGLYCKVCFSHTKWEVKSDDNWGMEHWKKYWKGSLWPLGIRVIWVIW